VQLARRLPTVSRSLWPLFVLTSVAHSQPDLALLAADECSRLDRTDRRFHSVGCEGVAAKIRVENGELVEGLRQWRHVFEHYDWVGERSHLSITIAALADALAPTEPALAVHLATISESDVIASILPSGLTGNAVGNLSVAVEHVGPDLVQSARTQAASMSYDDAMAYIYETIDRLIGADR
jgi:hypothetical protein